MDFDEGVFKNGDGVRSPTMGATHRSAFVFVAMLKYSRKRPSADQLVGSFDWSEVTIRSGTPPPLASIWYRSATRVRYKLNATRAPSGDQTGDVSTAINHARDARPAGDARECGSPGTSAREATRSDVVPTDYGRRSHGAW